MAATATERGMLYSPSQLCDPCQAIFMGAEPTEDNKRQHHDNMFQMKLAAQAGCHLCTSYLELFEKRISEIVELRRISLEPELPLEKYKIAVHVEKKSSLYPFALVFTFTYNESNGHEPKSFVMKPLHWKLYLGSSQQHEMTGSTASNATISRAIKWLHNCTTHHKYCKTANAESESQQRPTRLIDLGPLDILNSVPRLVEGKDTVSGVKYTTLSHCWGTHQPMQLTTSSLQSLKDGIIVSDLSQTFQDAISVTKALGIQYIWIDCLCILQNSIPDWQYESARMGDVYANAYCNIAASASSDGRGGLFRDRNPFLFNRCFVKVMWNVQKVQTYSTFINYDTVSSIFREEPLLRRGWVVQERLISPRILHFGKFELIWECSESLSSETFPMGLGLQHSRKGCQTLVHPPVGNTTAGMTFGQASLKKWCEIVRIYSACAVTFETDRLVAISGVARKMKAAMNSDYLGGLWRTNLEHQLLWTTDGYRPGIRPSAYISPSWSWASISGSEIQFPTAKRHQVLLDILEVTTISATEDKMAELIGGHLTLRCFMTAARMSSSNLKWVFDFRLDVWKGDDTAVPLVCQVQMDAEDGVSRETDLIYCVPVLHHLDDPYLYGLILVKTTDEKGFHRCGRFSVSPSHYDDFWKSCISFGNTGGFGTQPYLAIPTYEQTGDSSQRRSDWAYAADEVPWPPRSPYPLRDNIIQHTITIF